MKLSLENILACTGENGQNGRQINMAAKNHVTPQNSQLGINFM